MFETVQEIAVCIHRFHNLDLFQQGWYQIKISMRWEDRGYTSLATPARVVQYEAPDLGGENIYGIWKIDDTDNSFLTQPFRIKYARQDIRLSIMISFTLPLGENEGPSTSAVILKFELMQAPITENMVMAYPNASSVSVHEFRIPPKALLGLHSYCPVHFDAFHYVLVDASVHTSLMTAGSFMKVPSGSYGQDVAGKISDGISQALGEVASLDTKKIMLVKALLVSRDALLEELQKISKGIGHAIDLSDFISNMDDMRMFDSIMQENLGTADGEVSGQGKPHNGLEKANGTADFQSDNLPHISTKAVVVNIFHSLGAQLSYLWKIFLQFHRANKITILEFLRDVWTKDRRAEWSIWMVYSKVDMPHQYISSGTDDSFYHGHRRSSSVLNPAQSAATRADLHRRSIAQMRVSITPTLNDLLQSSCSLVLHRVGIVSMQINNRSIQDMYIFGDPLRIPIMIVERVANAPRRTLSENSYFRNLELVDSHSLHGGPGAEAEAEAGKKQSGGVLPKNGRELKAVIFVHGFQGHHLDLRLVRNQWLLIDPKMEFLMSEANEDKTSGDFREMGLRLAQEVISFLKKKMDRVSRSDIKLSFVGHSLGNIIIRTALAESIMEPYLRYLHTYVSISGPHLGYLYSSNSLFNSGMWLLKKLKGTRCIHQLMFTDDPNLQNTFLYKLCERKTLENFRHIVLLSSPQMLNNCLDQLRAPTSEHRLFLRCDVNFDTSAYGRNLNTIIGRAAHIEFLESDVFAKFIMWSFQELFC
eukprot:XP_024438737.1 protein FAM135B isoform X3 [Populus trichocarpa]